MTRKDGYDIRIIGISGLLLVVRDNVLFEEMSRVAHLIQIRSLKLTLSMQIMSMARSSISLIAGW